MSLELMWADVQANWHYLLMPFIAGFVGWVTKLLAQEMMFRPVEFVGIKPPYLGWQGVLPRKAEKMARTATDLLVPRLFSLEELIERLDAEKMLKELEEPLARRCEQLVREVGEKYMDGFWGRLPDFAQRAVVRRMQNEMPDVISEMWREIQKDPSHFIDIKSLVVKNLVRDKALLNQIFERIAAKEFVFFRNAGFWFGMGLGLVQLLCWLTWHKAWLIPAFGGVVGLLSDWVALQMLFRPLNPVRIFGITLHGRFIARRQEVARDYASLIAKELLTPSNFMEELLRGPTVERVMELIHRHIKDATDDQLGMARPLVLFAIGSDRYTEIRNHIVQRLMEIVPVETKGIEKFAIESLDVNNTIIARMDRLTGAELEGMLRPAFKEDEKTLVLCGALLGIVIGEIQVLLML